MTHPLTVAAPGELEVELTRRFEAPRQLVFEVWRHESGQEMGVRGVFRGVVEGHAVLDELLARLA